MLMPAVPSLIHGTFVNLVQNVVTGCYDATTMRRGTDSAKKYTNVYSKSCDDKKNASKVYPKFPTLLFIICVSVRLFIAVMLQ